MKWRRRIRAAIVWTGIAATMSLCAMWVASRWYTVHLALYPTVGLGFRSGQFVIDWERRWYHLPQSCTLTAFRDLSHIYGPWYEYWFGGSTVRFIPLWMLTLITFVPTALLFQSDRRRRRIEAQNLCAKCGYSKTGLPANHTCPECGTTASRTPNP